MRPRAWITAIIVGIELSLVSCGTTAPATILPVDQDVPLLPEQGILVVEVESNEKILRLAIEPTDRLGATISLRDLAPGRHAGLLVLPAGTYRWAEIDMTSNFSVDGRSYPATWKLERTEDHWQFSVKAGVVNYPGLLVIDREFEARMRIYTLNRSAQFVESIRAQPGGRLLKAHPLVYSGRGRDDFLEFYSQKLAHESLEEPPANDPEPVRD